MIFSVIQTGLLRLFKQVIWFNKLLKKFKISFFMRIGIGTVALIITASHLLQASPVKGQKMDQVAVQLSLNHESLIQGFHKIEAQSKFRFMYRYDQVKEYNDLTVAESKQTIESLVKLLLSRTALTYKQVKNQILIFPDSNVERSVGEQTSKNTRALAFIHGTVVNSEGDPLAGVSVALKGTDIGTSTDEKGKFTIAVTGSGTLVFSSIGFETQEVPVNELSTVTVEVVLLRTDKQLNTVIVTALGITRSVKSLTYAAQNVKGSELTDAKETNLINSLQGRVAGLTISRNAVGPGGESKVLLRGNRSLSGNNDPLYVIDGVPLNGGIEMLNSDDIESMTILKGAAAAALYGSQGQNGAIIITTKKARVGAVDVDYNGGVQFDQAAVLPELQYEYGQGDGGNYVSNSEHSWGPKAEGQSVQLWNGETVPLEGQPDRLKNFFRTAATVTNSITLKGGTEKVQAYFSYGNTYAEGIMQNNDLHRHNINLKVGFNPTDRLSFNTKLTYVFEDVNNRVTPGEGGTYVLPSIYRSPTSIPASEMMKYAYLDENGVEKQSYWKPGSSILENPYWGLNRVIYYQKKDRVIGLFVAKYKFTDWLDLQLRGSIDKTLQQTDHKIYGDNYFSLVGSDYEYATDNKQTSNIDLLFSFHHALSSKFDLSGNVGGASQQGNFASETFTANGLVRPNFFFLNNSTNLSTTDVLGKNPQVLSLYATATLKYNNYLYLDVTGRNDWSTALPKNNRSYFYPSIGLSGIISDMVQLPFWMSYGKARITFANSGYGGLQYLDQNYSSVLPGYTVVLSTVRSLGNYKPELTSSFEAGLEWQFFDDRVGFDATFYNTKSKNQLLKINVPNASLYLQKYINAGLIQNTGFELDVHGTPIRGQDFSWNVGLNYSTNHNQVKELAEGLDYVVLEDDREAQIRAAVGGSYGDMYVKDWTRDSATGKHIVDANGMPVLTAGNSVYLGNYNPKYMMGLQNQFVYKNWSLSFLIDYRNGGYVIAGTQALIDADGHSAASLVGREEGLVLDAVTVDGAKNTKTITSQAYFGAIGDRYPTGGLYAYSATNIRLREFILGYRLPKRWIKRSNFLKEAKLSVVGRNLFFFKRDAPIDPEIIMGLTGGGLEYAALPSTRNYGINLKVSF